MKKLISLFLILCMACMLIPAMAEDSAAGTWYLAELTQEGKTVNPSTVGMSWTITLDANGNATSIMVMGDDNEEHTGTWTQDGANVTVTIDDEPASFVFADGKLSISMGEEAQMVFTQEESAAAGITVADVNAGAAVEDFNGVWTPKYAGVSGMVVDASLIGQELPGFTLKDGSLLFTGSSTISSAFGSNALPMTYADGALSYTLSAGSMSLSIKAEMLQDGMMAVTFDVGMTLVLYMEKTGEAAEAPAA